MDFGLLFEGAEVGEGYGFYVHCDGIILYVSDVMINIMAEGDKRSTKLSVHGGWGLAFYERRR